MTEVIRVLVMVRALVQGAAYGPGSDGHSPFSEEADREGRNVHDLICWVIGPRSPQQREAAHVANPQLLNDVCGALDSVLPEVERVGAFGPNVQRYAKGLSRVKALEWLASAIRMARSGKQIIPGHKTLKTARRTVAGVGVDVSLARADNSPHPMRVYIGRQCVSEAWQGERRRAAYAIAEEAWIVACKALEALEEVLS